MFYYLLYNSSITNFKNSQKKTLTTLLYATFLYIIVHAYLNNSSYESIQKLTKYFWLVITLDVICFVYIYMQQNEEVNVIENVMSLVKSISSFTGKVLNYSGINDDEDEDEDKDKSNDKLVIEELKNKVNQILSKEKDAYPQPETEQTSNIQLSGNNERELESNIKIEPQLHSKKNETGTSKSTPLHFGQY